jgi:hypothetical protein
VLILSCACAEGHDEGSVHLRTAFAPVAGTGGGAQEIKLKASLHVAATHPVFGVSMVRLKEEVEKRSAGVGKQAGPHDGPRHGGGRRAEPLF